MSLVETVKASRWSLALPLLAIACGLLTVQPMLAAFAVLAILGAIGLVLFREKALVMLPLALIFPLVNYTPVPGVPGYLACSTLLVAMVGLFGLLSRHGPMRPLDWAVLACLALHVPTVLFSLDPRVSLRVLFELAAATAFYFFFAHSRAAMHFPRWWSWGLALATVVVSLVGLLQFVSNDVGFMGAFLDESNASERMTFGEEAAAKSIGFFRHANSLSLFLTLAVPALAGFSLTMQGNRRLVLWGAVGLGILAELTTLSRGGILSFGVAFAAIALASRMTGDRPITPRKAFPWLMVLLGAGLLALAMRFGLLDVVLDRFLNQAFEGRDAGSNFTRLINLAAAFNAFASNPLFGIGPGTSAANFVRFGGFSGLGPHNLLLLLASERGVFVLISFLGVLAIALATGFRTLRRSRSWVLVGALGALIGILVHGLFESVLADVFLPLFFATLGVIAHETRHEEKTQPSEAPQP